MYSIMIFPKRYLSIRILAFHQLATCIISPSFLIQYFSRTPYSPGWPFKSYGFKKVAKEIEVVFAGLFSSVKLLYLEFSQSWLLASLFSLWTLALGSLMHIQGSVPTNVQKSCK